MSRWLGGLMRLLPSAFRERFGAEILEDLRADFEAVRARGRLAAFG